MAVVRRLSWRDLNAVRGAALFAAVAMPCHAKFGEKVQSGGNSTFSKLRCQN